MVTAVELAGMPEAIAVPVTRTSSAPCSRPGTKPASGRRLRGVRDTASDPPSRIPAEHHDVLACRGERDACGQSDLRARAPHHHSSRNLTNISPTVQPMTAPIMMAT
jgi:hypothetical protein